MTAEPFKITVPDTANEKLKRKLADADFPDELDTADQWPYGAPLSDVKRLASGWQNGFGWRGVENALNKQLPMYRKKVSVEGFGNIDIHFVHQASTTNNAIPLLFCHGWPGSFIEVSKILPDLSGYDKYVTQGGDWGFYITRSIGLLYPESCLASHINMVRANPPSWDSWPHLELQHAVTPYTEAEKMGLERSNSFLNQGQAYPILQSTKPKLSHNYEWKDDEILPLISIYWFSTADPNAHVRIYYEAQHSCDRKIPNRQVASEYVPSVKLGVAHFPKELSVAPRLWVKTMGPLVYESNHDSGGHFAAWERPEVIIDDLRNMIQKSGPCYRFVPGKDGY